MFVVVAAVADIIAAVAIAVVVVDAADHNAMMSPSKFSSACTNTAEHPNHTAVFRHTLPQHTAPSEGVSTSQPTQRPCPLMSGHSTQLPQVFGQHTATLVE